MSDDRFQIVMRTFERALEVDPAARPEFLQTEVGHDPETLKEVRALLAHHEAEASPVATGVGLAAVGPAPTVTFAAGDKAPLPVLTGNYRILRTIGEGGMGIVFEAEQAFPRRRVALKAVRPGMASRSLLRRFRNEVELLGRLQHPGIAHLYEAGIADELSPDQAFFAMELVDGCPLTQFAKEQNLDLRHRWLLLLKVCEAVQHAHQRGVIHRDLKPGNILVGRDGQPKVVDFGIARAAEDSHHPSMATRTGQLVGTPSYMSPEQMRSDEVDTRSDVYALGVVAYELLAGRLPFNLVGIGLDEASRIIREDEPPPISRFDKALRGDAEVIVLKCLAKEPDRRYASAAELAEDIRRYIAGDAIAARRDSAMYLLRKQVRRHRTAARLIVLGFIALVAFAIYASISAERQRHLALAANIARDQERVAKEDAIRATTQAVRAREEALAARAVAESELAQSNIERGRLEAASGNLSLAEDILWRAYFADPASPSSRWGLWELYDRIPSAWVVQGPSMVGYASPSANGRRIAWATPSGRASVFDVRTGLGITTVITPGGAATVIALSPDGLQLFASSARSGSFLLPLIDTSVSIPIESLSAQRAAAYSPKGDLLATVGDDRTVRLWDPATVTLIRSWPIAGTPRTLAFSADGALLAVAGLTPAPGLAAGVWNVADGSLIADLSAMDSRGVTGLAFFRTSPRLAISHIGGTLSFWTPGATALKPSNYTLGGEVRTLTPAPDDRFILVGASDRPYLVDSFGEREARALVRHRYPLSGCVWNDAGGSGPVGAGDVTVATSDGLLRRMGLTTNVSASRIPGFASWCFSVAYSPDGSRIAVGTDKGTVDIIDVATRALAARWSVGNTGFRTRQVRFLDNQRLLAAGNDGVLRLIDAATGGVIASMPGAKDELFALAVSPDSALAAIGHASRSTRLFDLRTLQQVAELPILEKRIESLAFSPDGKSLAISGLVRGIAIWDIATSQITRRLETTSQPWGVVFTPDGERMIASTQGGSIESFSTKDWSRERTVQGHQRLIPALAVSPDGRLIATGGEDALVKLWDAATLRNLASFDTQGVVIVSLAFSPDSKRLAGASANRFVIEYDLAAADARISGHKDFYRRRLPPVPRAAP